MFYPLTLFILCLFSFSSLLHAYEYRSWKNKKGLTIQARIINARDDGINNYKAFFVTLEREDGKMFDDIPLDSLSAEDQEYVFEINRKEQWFWRPPSKSSKVIKSLDSIDIELKTLTSQHSLVRQNLPKLSQSEFKSGNKSCGPASLLTYLYWWGETLYPDLLPKGTQEQQLKRMHRELVVYCKSSSGGTSLGELIDGLAQYLEKREKKYKLVVARKALPDPVWLKKHCTKGNAIILVHGYYKQKGNKFHREGGHYSSMVDFHIEGALLTNTWGHQYALNLIEKESKHYRLRRAHSMRYEHLKNLENRKSIIEFHSLKSQNEQIVYATESIDPLKPFGHRDYEMILEAAVLIQIEQLGSSATNAQSQLP